MDTLAVTGRADLSDAQWAVLEPLLPRGRKPGRPPDRTKRRSSTGFGGGPGRARRGGTCLPAYGPWQTVYGLFRRWQRNGTWRVDPDRLAGPRRCGRADHLGRVRGFHGGAGAPARAGARRRGDLQAEPPGGVSDEPADHGLGRSRGGLTTKVHLACEQGQKPLSVIITAGQRGDSPQFQVVLWRIRVPRPGRGRPRTRPGRVLADKAYGSRANRAYLRHAGSGAPPGEGLPNPPPPGQSRHGGRPPAFDPEDYKARHAVECVSASSSATAPWPPATTSWLSATSHLSSPHQQSLPLLTSLKAV